MDNKKLKEKVLIGLADDHVLFRHGIKMLLSEQKRYEVIFDVNDGSEVIKCINSGLVPDILLLGVQMKSVQGKQTAEWVTCSAPEVKIIILSTTSDDNILLEMILAGAKGYLPKDSHPSTMFEHIERLHQNEIYFSEKVTSKLLLSIQKKQKQQNNESIQLSEREKQFLIYLCQEYTGAEIAKKMHLSPRTIDDICKQLTKKLCVRSRFGLIVYAVTNMLHLKDNSSHTK